MTALVRSDSEGFFFKTSHQDHNQTVDIERLLSIQDGRYRRPGDTGRERPPRHLQTLA
jgi:hypothetical protein